MTSNIYIEYDKGRVRLPVLPSEFEISATQGNTTVVIHDFGEINLKGDRGLYSISLSSFFPNEYYYFCKCEPKAPSKYIKIFKELFEKNETVQLIITTTPINFFCTISDFAYSKNDGTGDINFTMKFTEYRECRNKTVKSKTTKARPAKKKKGGGKKYTYTWKKGDTWAKVAKKETGFSTNAAYLKKINKKYIQAAKKKYCKIHHVKTVKDSRALVGYNILIDAEL